MNFEFKLTTTTLAVATGVDFPDALSGSVLAARRNAGVMVIDNKDASSIKSLVSKQNINNIILLGGEGVISKDIENSFIGK